MTASTITETQVDKGLKPGALSLVSNIVIGVASVAPAYSLAATLGFVVALVGLITPLVVVIAFIPMLFVSIGYSEMNKADPDCGTTFTWATRAFGPRTGWMGGWATLASDILVMASLAQVASQYTYLLFNATSIGRDATSGWVLLLGVVFIAVMTYICYRGIEISARIQRVLLSIEVVMLLVFGLVALVRVLTGNAPPGHVTPSFSWFNPGAVPFSALVSGLILMLFIYWGWDTSVSVNEETADRTRSPGLAAIISTVLLLWMILGFLVVTSVLLVSFGRLGDMCGRVRMYNLGFVVYTLASLALTVDWMTGPAGAIYLIAFRLVQGIGAAFLLANSAAILTDAFPANQRGMALGINNIVGVSGVFIGLVLGGVLAPLNWRLVFLISVPGGVLGTVWAYRSEER